jgi:hypothetical protein
VFIRDRSGRGVIGCINVYSPPPRRLGRYSIDPDAVMRRVHVSYADELRPVETASAA